MLSNPMSTAISQLGKQFSSLEFTSSKFVPSIILAVILIVLITIFIILWPYGWVAVIEDTIRGLMRDAVNSIRTSEVGSVQLAFGFALVLYTVVWIPFALLYLPFVIFGFIGAFFASISE